MIRLIRRSLADRQRPNLRQLLERFWWFDLVYPLTLALILFGLLTGIVYSGRPSSRLAALAENKLLEFALLSAQNASTVAANGDIVIVSAVPIEIKNLRPAPAGQRPEVSAADYANVINRLAEDGVEYVFINWDLSAHLNDDIYYLPLIEAASRNRGRTKLLFAVASNRRLDFPRSLESVVTVLDDVRCSDRADRETFCPYLPDLSGWVISAIVKIALAERAATFESPKNPDWLTSLLPANAESFALHLPLPQSLTTVSFEEVLRDSKPIRARFAFIGADPSGAASGTSDSRFVETVFDDPAAHIDAAGTALHVYWAQIASMFLRDDLLRFPPDWIRFPLTAAVCLVVAVSMFRLSGSIASTFLIAYGAAALLLNIHLAVPSGHFFPLFDSLYFGLATVAFAGSVRLSHLSFLKWRLQENQKIHAQTADLKSNFLSLVSHNLNTPVAKMQGMISIARGSITDPRLTTRLSEAQRLVTYLELTIRFLLNSVAVEDGRLNEAPRSLDSIFREFMAANQNTLKKVGINPSIVPRGDSPELFQIPVRLDIKVMTSTLAAMATLFAVMDPSLSFDLCYFLDATEDDEGGWILLRVSLVGGASAGLAPTGKTPLPLLKEVAGALVARTADHYRGHVNWVGGTGAAPSLEVFFRLPL